ncbi:MAG TPA: DUF975 family protein [Candidatus Faecousia intestinigallinarum]|nr:DUF975 family protein [Candidatus Faecousia intestinigallinarum]
MNIRDISSLGAKAEEDLRAAGNSPRKLVLLHSGITVAVMTVLTLMNLLLQLGIDDTAGLGGLGARAAMSTMQTLLGYAINIVLPFWEFGMAFVILGFARRQLVAPADLTLGFRNFGPVLRYQLLIWLMYFGIAMMLLYPLMNILLLTPLANPIIELAVRWSAAGGAIDLGELIGSSEFFLALLPMLLAAMAVLALVLVPLAYRLKMGKFSLADDPKAGAMAAVRRSFRITRGNSLALFKLDLHFWWYYLGLLLAAAVCYGDVILGYLGVPLPMSQEASYMLFYVLGLALQLGLHCLALARVQLTYAAGYDALLGGFGRHEKQGFPASPWQN